MKQLRSLLVSVPLVILGTLACTSTTGQRAEKTAETRGFLGNAQDLLKPGKEGEAQLRYVNSRVDWSQYNQILFEPVQFWAASDTELSPDAQQLIATYFYGALKKHLEEESFSLAELPGPGVIRVQMAITDATTAVPVLRTVSLVVPITRVINQAQEAVTGSYTFAGSAEVAMRATDAKTGQLLAAAIDRRGGGGSLEQAAVWQWGDVEAAIDHWTKAFASHLAELRAKARAGS